MQMPYADFYACDMCKQSESISANAWYLIWRKLFLSISVHSESVLGHMTC